MVCARYSEALYAEQNAGKEAGLKAVDEFAVGALNVRRSRAPSPRPRAASLTYSPDISLRRNEQRAP